MIDDELIKQDIVVQDLVANMLHGKWTQQNQNDYVDAIKADRAQAVRAALEQP